MLPIPIDSFKIFITRLQAFQSNDLLEDNDLQVCEELYEHLIDTTEKILEILKGNIN